MSTNWQDVALAAAGVIGAAVAVVHGVLTQKLMIGPFENLARDDQRISAPIRRLVPMLLHYSTVSWFFGGLALIAAALWFQPDARVATGLFVGAQYLYGVVGNFWGTRGRHPGWMLLAVALVLIGIGLSKAGG